MDETTACVLEEIANCIGLGMSEDVANISRSLYTERQDIVVTYLGKQYRLTIEPVVG